TAGFLTAALVTSMGIATATPALAASAPVQLPAAQGIAEAASGLSIFANAPGNPGTPSAPKVIYAEDFENVDAVDPVQRLTEYEGLSGQEYTADAGWLTGCNGWVASALQSTTAAAQVADCNGQQSWNAAQQLAQALGMHAGAADA